MSRERRAVLVVFAILILGGIINFTVAAARGRDLGAPAGILVGAALFGITAWLLTRSRESAR